MAKEIKAVKPQFNFTGLLKEGKVVESKKGANGFELTLEDKVVKSEVKLTIWGSKEARYYDNLNKQTVTVTSDIESTMEKVTKNGTGRPFGIKFKTPKEEKFIYINNEIIEKLSKLPNNKFYIRVSGDVSFQMYNGRVSRNYNISSVEVYQKPVETAFDILLPAVVANDDKNKFIYSEHGINTVPVLVKTKLDNGQYGYRPIKLALDKENIIGASTLKKVSEQKNMKVVDIINNNIMPAMIKEMKDIDGYVVGLVRGKLKTGQIVREASEEDITPMELQILKMLGEDAIKEKLKTMPKLEEYFDDMLFVAFDLCSQKLFEPINESDLNLNTNDDVVIGSNPMMSAINEMLAGTTESPFVVEEDKKEAKVEDLSFEEEQPTVEEVKEETEDDFPF